MSGKRLAAGAMSILMILSLAGCSNKDTSSSAKDSKGGTSSVTTVEKQEFPDEDFKTMTDGSAKVKVENAKLTVGGKDLWINGVNSAWDKWNDFGGVFDMEFWDNHFSQLHEAGCNASRIWVVCNGDVGLEIAPDGNLKGATKAHWEDLDNLFVLAEKYQIYLMPTVMSFDFFKNEQQATNKHTMWRDFIKDDKKVDSYVDNYIVPFVERYGKSDYLWCVDLCNEPDWIKENASCGVIKWEYLQKYFAKATAAIHEHSDVLVTVGMAMIKYNSDEVEGNVISDKALQEALGDNSKYDKSKAYVDFYSTHWYPWMNPNWGINYTQTPKAFKQDTSKPCIIAEIPAVVSKKDMEQYTLKSYDLANVYEAAYKNGWQGMMAWKASGGNDGNGSWADCEKAIKKMMKICPEKIYPAGKKDVK